jgi:hypothetical protein
MKCSISFLQQSFFVLLSTKLKPRRAFFGSFHSWTVIGTLSLTTTPHWLINFAVCCWGLPVALTASMVYVSPYFIALDLPRFVVLDPAEG